MITSDKLWAVEKKLSKPKIQKESQDKIKNIRNLFKLEKEIKAIKDRIISNNKYLFEHQEEDYCKLVRVGNFWNNNYTEHESNDDRNKNLSINEYLDKIKLYLKIL